MSKEEEWNKIMEKKVVIEMETWRCIREKREEIRLLDNMLKDIEKYFYELENG